MKSLFGIAKDTFPAVASRGSLETRNNDSEDFIEVAVWEIKQALREAYKLGQQEAIKNHKGECTP